MCREDTGGIHCSPDALNCPIFATEKLRSMDLIAELTWRGMIHEMTPGIDEYLRKPGAKAYIGFDPTAPSLGLGNYVQIMLLTHFKRCGHTPIVLMGGATGRIGDPSGKDRERELKSYDEIDHNLAVQARQLRRFLQEATDAEPLLMVNNYDFYRDMHVLDFLRDIGKTVTVNYMMAKESVKKRIETGISFTEFSYQLIQAYDFQCLYQQYDCRLQMGGSDQWGNITSGTEFIRRNLGGKAYALTTPLLTKADGSKFGKSETGNIWLDPSMTSPYAFYQFWINTDDRDLPAFTRYFSLKSRKEIEALEAEHHDNPQHLKTLLAEEITARVHSAEALDSAQKVSRLLFQPKADCLFLQELSPSDWAMARQELPGFQIQPELIDPQGLELGDLLADKTQILSSRGEVRRAVSNNAISINKVKIADFNHRIHLSDFLYDQYLLIENGKKNKYLITIA
jgi:tyrosyl-tRNA synthetase